MMWEIASGNKELEENFSKELDVPLFAAKMLVNRGIPDIEGAIKFIAPKMSNLHSPFLMKGMEEGVKRIRVAIQKGELICVYGDFDADGISGTALLVLTLQKLSARVIPYIPHRLKEGYGLNVNSIKKLREEGVGLLITVDCGITSIQEVGFARTLGMDVIITDHHEPLAISPPACAIINPKQIGCQYPFKELAGVGVAFKLCQALNNLALPLPEGLISAESLLLEKEDGSHLDLVALGTIADLVPLQDENRVLVKYGLQYFSRTTKVGLRALGEVSGTDLIDVDATHIGYRFAPRINAGGRMEMRGGGSICF